MPNSWLHGETAHARPVPEQRLPRCPRWGTAPTVQSLTALRSPRGRDPRRPGRSAPVGPAAPREPVRGGASPRLAYLLSSSAWRGPAASWGAGTRLCSDQRQRLQWSRQAEKTPGTSGHAARRWGWWAPGSSTPSQGGPARPPWGDTQPRPAPPAGVTLSIPQTAHASCWQGPGGDQPRGEGRPPREQAQGEGGG